MNHDRLFKELLGTFFLEFIQLFLPKLSAIIDETTALIPVNKEIFSDVTLGDSREVDLVMRAKTRGHDAVFLIHVEHQAASQSDFPQRMFRYFAKLTEAYNVPVYPIVIYSHNSPLKSEPKKFRVELAGKRILIFEYTMIQLNRISWRRFLRKNNPVACALMSKMWMRPADRPKVKAECLRMLVTFKLDPARTRLIAGFIDSYLKLSADEMKIYRRTISKFAPEERDATMEIMTSWEEQGFIRGMDQGRNEGLSQGLIQGLIQGKEQVIARQIRRRFGVISSEALERIEQLSPVQLDNLAEALLDFESPSDVVDWLNGQ